MSRLIKPDGYSVFGPSGEASITDCYEHLDQALADFGDASNYEIEPVKLIKHATWLKLIDWCKRMAIVHRRSLETLNCDDELNEIFMELGDEHLPIL